MTMPGQNPIRVHLPDGSTRIFPAGTSPERIKELTGMSQIVPNQPEGPPEAPKVDQSWWSRNEPMIPAEDIYRKYFEPKKPTPYGWSEADIGAKRGISRVTQELSRPKSAALLAGMGITTALQPHAMAPFVLNALFGASMAGDIYDQLKESAPPAQTTRDKWARGSSIGMEALLAAAPWAIEGMRARKIKADPREGRYGEGLIPASWTNWLRNVPKEAMAPKYPANIPPRPPVPVITKSPQGELPIVAPADLGPRNAPQPAPGGRLAPLQTPETPNLDPNLIRNRPYEPPAPVTLPPAAATEPQIQLRAPQRPLTETIPPMPEVGQTRIRLTGTPPPIEQSTIPPLPASIPEPIIPPRAQGTMSLTGEAPPIAETILPPPRTPEILPATAPGETLPPGTSQPMTRAKQRAKRGSGLSQALIKEGGIDWRSGGTTDVDPGALKGVLPEKVWKAIFGKKDVGVKVDSLGIWAQEKGFPLQTDADVRAALENPKMRYLTAEKMAQGETEKIKKEGYWEGIARQLMEEKKSDQLQNEALDNLGIGRETVAPEDVPFNVGEPVEPRRGGIREPGQEGFARIRYDEKKLGTPIPHKHFTEGTGAFILPDGRIVDIGSRAHLQALHVATGSKFKLEFDTVGDWWHNTMRDTGLVRLANYDGQMVMEMHNKPTPAQVDAVRALKSFWPKLRFLAEMWPPDAVVGKRGQLDHSKMSEVQSLAEFLGRVDDPTTWSSAQTKGNRWTRPLDEPAANILRDLWTRGEEGFAKVGGDERQKSLFTPATAPAHEESAGPDAGAALINQILKAKDSNISKRDLLGLNAGKKKPTTAGKGFDFSGKLFSNLPAFMIPWIIAATRGKNREDRAR